MFLASLGKFFALALECLGQGPLYTEHVTAELVTKPVPNGAAVSLKLHAELKTVAAVAACFEHALEAVKK